MYQSSLVDRIQFTPKEIEIQTSLPVRPLCIDERTHTHICINTCITHYDTYLIVHETVYAYVNIYQCLKIGMHLYETCALMNGTGYQDLIHEWILTVFVAKSTWSSYLRALRGETKCICTVTRTWGQNANGDRDAECFLLQWHSCNQLYSQSPSVSCISNTLTQVNLWQAIFGSWCRAVGSLWEASKKPLLEARDSEDQVSNNPPWLAPSVQLTTSNMKN